MPPRPPEPPPGLPPELLALWMKKDPVRRQHFVPVSYLKRFANAGHKLERLKKEQRTIGRPRSPSSCARFDYYYAIRTGIADAMSHLLEIGYMAIETQHGEVWPDIRDRILDPNSTLTQEDKMHLAVFMAMLWLRGPAMRDSVNRTLAGVITSAMKKELAVDSDAYFDRFDRETNTTTSPEDRAGLKAFIQEGQYEIEMSNAPHAAASMRIEDTGNMLIGMKWTVYVASTSKRFITSDNPFSVVLGQDASIEKFPFRGVECLCALTPHICVHIRGRAEPFSKAIGRKTLDERHAETVGRTNFEIANHARCVVFSSQRETLEDVLNSIADP